MKPNGSAIPTYFPSSCQKRTSHTLSFAGWNDAAVVGRVIEGSNTYLNSREHESPEAEMVSRIEAAPVG